MSDLFEINNMAHCERCGTPVKVAGPQNSKAKMLRRSKKPKGLCVNCAVHDWLQNTYPVNMILAGSGPKALVHPHIQKQFTEIMRVGLADAKPDEINWDLIIENWDLPFKNKVKGTATNPASQAVLDREPAERARREARLKEEFEDPGRRQRELDDVINNEFLPLMQKLGNQE
ncbi:MAG: hypothetical protein PHY02_06470 [Phycisphaerae bacterium]|nr:hypothetical protein [Phycisphaerae bacterium]